MLREGRLNPSVSQFRKSIFLKPGKDVGQVACPHGLWLDPRGDEPRVAVADRSNRRIQIFDLDGKPVSMHTDGVRRPCDVDFREGVMLVEDAPRIPRLQTSRTSSPENP